MSVSTLTTLQTLSVQKIHEALNNNVITLRQDKHTYRIIAAQVGPYNNLVIMLTAATAKYKSIENYKTATDKQQIATDIFEVLTSKAWSSTTHKDKKQLITTVLNNIQNMR